MMIRKTLTVTIALILLWSVIVKLLPQDLNTYQSQRDRNLILAQDYLYSTPNIHEKKVILGTSLSQRIVLPLLPEDFYNLAFGGQGIFDGIDVVNYHREKPRVVFIEMNNVMKEEGELFTETLFAPIPYHLKKYFPFLRDRNKPIGVLRGLTRSRRQASLNFDTTEDTIERSSAYQTVLSQQKDAYKKKLQKKKMNLAFQKLKQSVEQIEKEGSIVVFFEMPIHRELCVLPRVKTLRKRFFSEFPQDKYFYIKQPDCSSYQTTDGIHLTIASGNRYSMYFKKEVEALPI